MVRVFPLFASLSAALSPTVAHMSLYYPPQFKTPWNPKAQVIDVDHRDPIIRQTYPCKLAHIGMTEASSVATWKAGSTQKFQVTGTATHNGGSCQASLSYDQGQTFNVIHSYIGGCPQRDMQSFTFKVPADAPEGLAIFSWSWFNKVGNREFYQKCAAVTIEAGSDSSTVPFSQRPMMFVANLDESRSVCKSIENMDVVFPNPGPDVTGPLGGSPGYRGDCQIEIPRSYTSDSRKSKQLPIPSWLRKWKNPKRESSKDTEYFETRDNFPGNTTLLDDGAKVNISLLVGANSGLPTSPDGTCGPTVGYQCIPGACCSQWNYCGIFEGHCADKCQSAYGQCRGATASPPPSPTPIPPPRQSVTPAPAPPPAKKADASGSMPASPWVISMIGMVFPWILL